MYDAVVRLALAVLVAFGSLSCAAVPAAQTVREVRIRPDRRVLRENRALRREVRALRDELAQTRTAAQSDAVARQREGEAQSAIVAGLAQQIQVLAQTIGDLQDVLHAQTRATVLPPRASGRGGAFGKVRVGTVPTQSRPPPEPRGQMDQPDLDVRPPDLLDPFSKAAVPSRETLR